MTVRSMASGDGKKFGKMKVLKAQKIRNPANARIKPFSRPEEDRDNQFIGNTGAARSMKAIGFDDHDDPSLTHIFGKGAFPDLSKDPRDSLEDLYEETEANKRELKINKQNPISKQLLKKILTQKRFYPDIQPPNLLTWVEKQTIRSLHDTEPGEWTARKLSECFPAATEAIIKDVIKNRCPKKLSSVQAKAHDDIVRDNWRLLTQGKFQDKLGQDLYNHLLTVAPKLIKEGNFSSLTSANIRQLEETMLEVKNKDSEETFCITPRSAKGPFGSIIADYAQKVESKIALQDKQTTRDLSSTVIEEKNLLIDGDIPRSGGPKYARDPRRGTALINVDIDLRTEKPMTMDTFKEIFKENLSSNQENDVSFKDSSIFFQSSPVHSMSKQFLKWLQIEHEKTNMISHSVDYKVECNETNNIRTTSRNIKKKNKLTNKIYNQNSDISGKDFSKSKWIVKLKSERNPYQI